MFFNNHDNNDNSICSSYLVSSITSMSSSTTTIPTTSGGSTINISVASIHLMIHPWCHQIPPWTHLQMNLFTSFLISMRLLERAEKFHHCRVEWERHALIFLHEKQFDSKYRMSYGSFKKLVELHPLWDLVV